VVLVVALNVFRRVSLDGIDETNEVGVRRYKLMPRSQGSKP